MAGSKAGTQTIGCRVSSCRYHSEGDGCSLSRIQVEPVPGCDNGKPGDESLCGSYKSHD